MKSILNGGDYVMRSAAITAGVCLSLIASCFAQTSTAVVARVETTIPAQKLESALKLFTNLDHVQVLYLAADVDNVRTSGASGYLTADETLRRLLKGTSLQYRYVSTNSVSIIPGNPATSNTPPAGKATHADRAQDATKPRGPQQELEPKHSLGHRYETSHPALKEVVVTGTHIRGIQTSSPPITITAKDIANSGYTDIGDVMRALPQNSASGASPQTLTGSGPFGAAASNFAFGSAPNLRGLGPSSTLTLVNGHRLPQDSPSGAVDISLVPVDAIDHIDVETDGASAVYGSDAVAGVVNIILKRHYDGSQTSVSYGNSTEKGGRDWRVSELVGTSWATGSVLAVYEHEEQDAVDASQRSFTSTVLTPYSLLPATTRDSGYVSARQELSPDLEAYADGLYTSRQADVFQTFVSGSYYIPSPVRAYQATAGLNYSLPNAWELNGFGSYGMQTSTYNEFLLPAQSALYTETQRGTTRTVEMDADGPLIELPTGPTRIALGVGNRAETYSDVNPPSSAIAVGSRHINYAFGELNLPLVAPSERLWLMGLDIDVAGRYEHYSDFGHAAVPKVGLLYTPSKQVKVRVLWGRSFRAPALSNVYEPYHAYLSDIPDPASTSPTGESPIIELYGGRPTLEPETATSETVNLQFTPSYANGLSITPTYFHIAYRNRIGEISDSFAALTDPANAPFVVRNPSPALQQSIIAGAVGGFPNYTGGPYDPSTVVAIVDARPFNFGRQDIVGEDLLAIYTKTTRVGTFEESLNGTYMDIWQQVTPLSPTVALAGTSFNPPRVRARASVNWSLGSWSATGTFNYFGHEVNALEPGQPAVSSWTTIDTQIAYRLPKIGAVEGARVSVSVLNLFDRDPPFLKFNSFRQGFNYDVVNATPMGRFVTVQAEAPVSW